MAGISSNSRHYPVDPYWSLWGQLKVRLGHDQDVALEIEELELPGISMTIQQLEDGNISLTLGEDTIPGMAVVTRPAPEWVLSMHDDGGSTHEVTFNEQPDTSDIHSEIEDWVKEGEWGDDGASVSVGWTLEEDGDEIDDGWYTVDIEPNEEALIEAAGGDTDCDHDWTAEGEGGCTENPGVWSTGGTSMSFATHCRKCGLHRVEHTTNPSEHDTVHFEQPASWCAMCECEECTVH